MKIEKIFSLDFRVANVIYTEPGIRQGFTLKEIRIFGFVGTLWVSFSVPFWVLSYNKKEAQELQKIIDILNKAKENDKI